MRRLLPQPVEPDVDVHEHYAADWLERGGLRVNFVSSADGAVSANGRSAGLQTPGDNAVFAALRDLADVVLVGSGTAVAEGYGAVRLGPGRVAARTRFGLAPALPIAVTTHSASLDPASALFADAAPNARTIVLTCATAPTGRRAALAEVADVEVCGDDEVDPVQVRAALERRGLTCIVAEGGPRVFADQARAGVVDELCLSLAPTLVGPGPGRIVSGDVWHEPRPLRLTGLLEDDGALFLRYRVARPEDGGASDT